jgi:hypothetical protein
MRTPLIALAIVVTLLARHASAITYTTLDHPLVQVNSGNGLGTGTYAYDVQGNTVVGVYTGAGGLPHGFTYDGSTYTTLDNPLGVKGTWLTGIDGTNIVGFYADASSVNHAFLYDGTTFTTINPPSGTIPVAPLKIEGNNIVGTYGSHGFLYNGSTFTTLDAPGATQTFAAGISSGKIVGTYRDSAQAWHGFSYDGTSYTVFDSPDAAFGSGSQRGTRAQAIDANNIVGFYLDGPIFKGFFYDGSSFTKLEVPGSLNGTYAIGIDSKKVVGYWVDSIPSSARAHGFITVVPEPSSVILAAIGAIVLPIAARKRRVAGAER